MSQKFTLINLEAGLDTLPAKRFRKTLSRRREIAIDLYNKELAEGTSHQKSIELALEAAVKSIHTPNDAKELIKIAKNAAGVTLTARANATAKPVVDATKKLTNSTKIEKKTRTKPKRQLTLFIGAVIGFFIGLLLALIFFPPMATAYENFAPGASIPFALVWFSFAILFGIFIGTYIQYRSSKDTVKVKSKTVISHDSEDLGLAATHTP